MAKVDSVIDVALLEHCLREDLNKRAARVMAVLRPLKVVITNYPEGQSEELEAVNNPEDPAMGTRKVPFARELWIEQDDFREDPPKGYYRLSPGKEVRLRWGYLITCTEAVKDPKTGEVVELHCTYDPATRGGNAPDGRKVKGTIHWVSAAHAVQAEVRLYENLFTVPDPSDVPEGVDYKVNLNPKSLEVLPGCCLEPSLAAAKAGDRFQFERLGYFAVDPDTDARQAGLQPHRVAARHLGEDREGAEVDLPHPPIFGNICRIMVIAAGPTSTTKMPGKMKSTSGKSSLTAVLAAFSSAIWRRRMRIDSLCTRRAWAMLEPNLSAWIEHGGQGPQVGHAGPHRPGRAGPRPACGPSASGSSSRRTRPPAPGRRSSFPRSPCASPGPGPGRPRRTRPSCPARRAGPGRSPAAGAAPGTQDDVRQPEAERGHARHPDQRVLAEALAHSNAPPPTKKPAISRTNFRP